MAQFCALFTIAFTLPNNQFYHQEYKYKTSASSYRNNELQQQNDDEGYMSKHGDLEGRTIPIVQSHSQRSEYINPKLRDGYITPNSNSYYNGDTSEGYMDVDSTMGVNAGLMNNLNGYGPGYGYSGANRNSYSYGGTYGSYSVPSNLRSIAQQLQEDYARQLQHYQYGYNRDFSTLEQELRQNVTQRLQEALMNRYGSQSIRSGLSYSINNGRVLPTANYEHQELLDLQRQMENELISQLRRQYYSQSSYQSGMNSNYQRYSTSTSTPRPYTSYTTHVPIYAPTYTSTTTGRIPVYAAPYAAYSSTAQRESITNIATRVQSDLDSRLNTILDNLTRNRQYGDFSSLSSRLENELRTNISYLLDREIQRIYGNQIQRDGYMYSALPNGNYDTQYNYNIRDLENLKRQMENNLLTKLNRDLGRYTTTSNLSNQSGYLQNRYTDYSTNNLGSNYYSTSGDVRGDAGHTSRPSSPHLIPLITGTKSHKSYNYQSTYGTSGISANTISELQSQLQNDLSRQLQAALNRNRYGYSSYGPRNYQVSFQELSDELNRNLTRQLNELQSRYSTSDYSSYSTQQFDDLRNQLQNNLMRELQQGLQHSYSSSSSYSASSSSSSSNYRPVRANTAESYPSPLDCLGQYGHAVYKRSPVYYRPQYISSPYASNQFLQSQRSYYQPVDEDLTQQQEEPGFENLQIGGQQQIEDLDLTQQQEDDFEALNLKSTEKPRQQEESFEKLQIGSQHQTHNDFKPQFQQIEDLSLTQQQEEPSFEKLQNGNQDSDLTQQQQEDDFKPLSLRSTERTIDLSQQQEENNFERLQIGSQQQIQDDFKPQSQQVEEIDLTQQQEEPGFEKLQIGSQQQIEGLTQQQQEDDFKALNLKTTERTNHLPQQEEENKFEKFQIGSQQKLDDSDLTQLQQQEYDFDRVPPQLSTHQFQEQVEDVHQHTDSYSGRVPAQISQNQVEESDLTQQQEEPGFEKLQVGNQQQLEDNFGQQLVENVDLTQQQEEPGFGKLQIGSHQQLPAQISQNQVEEQDLTQQQEEPGFENLQLASQQQVEDGFGQLEVGHYSKPNQQVETFETTKQLEDSQKHNKNLDLTQQQEQDGFDKLQTGSQNWQQELRPNQVDDVNLTQQQEIDDGFGKFEVENQRQTTEEESVYTTQVNEEITESSTLSTSTRRQPTNIDREFLAKIERENDMLIEMIRQRALENQRRAYQSQHYYQDSYNSHYYNPNQHYHSRTYSSPYSGRSTYQAVPQEVDTVYHRAEVQKPVEIETANTVEILEPIEADLHTPTHVKSEHLARDDNVNEESTEIPTTTQTPGFWKRLGNKISTGAKSLKEKIVG